MTARRDGGFAIIIVLWTVGLLALLGSHIAASARNAAQASGRLRDAAIAEAAADGVALQAIFHLLAPPRDQWPATGVAHAVPVAGGRAVVTITDDAGRINPGNASGALLVALLRHVGVPDQMATNLGAAMLDWRTAGTSPSAGGAKDPQYLAARRPYGPPRERYVTVEELLLVLGMTPAIYERLEPFLSVHKTGGVDLNKADPIVIAAVTDVAKTGQVAAPPPPEGAAMIVHITADVLLAGGVRAVRRAQVEIGTNDEDAIRPYRILAWD